MKIGNGGELLAIITDEDVISKKDITISRVKYKAKSKAISLAHPKAYLAFLGALCERALPAAVLEVLPVRPSRRTLEAARAALAEVVLALAM